MVFAGFISVQKTAASLPTRAGNSVTPAAITQGADATVVFVRGKVIGVTTGTAVGIGGEGPADGWSATAVTIAASQTDAMIAGVVG